MPLRVKLIYILSLVLALTLIRMVYLTKSPPPDTDIVGIRGVVQEIKVQEGQTGNGTLFVKGAIYSDTVYDQAYVSLDSSTQIYHVTDKKNESPLSITDLRDGEYVDVYFDGPVMESHPVQGRAKKIIITTIKNAEPTDEETKTNGK